MGRTDEERLLRRAIEKGLLDAGDLESADGAGPSTGGRWGARIERLLKDGRLDEIAVAALAEEVSFWSATEARSTLETPPAQTIDPEVLDSWDGYTILARLGGGGGGEVFRAHDSRLGRDVALKFLHPDRLELAARLRREARAQARIEHEHVCKVYEVGERRGRSFIAMQFIDGRTLDAAAAEMTLEDRVRLVRQVAEAAHAAHRLGIVHRDIKPGNVLVERDDDGASHAWVVDFGLAREMDRSVGATVGVVGTPAFMAPEQARGDPSQIDRRSDVYSLGATLFAVLAGRPPFLGSTVETLVQVIEREPPPLRDLARHIPADLGTIVAKCLEKDPSQRYDSARALADDLGRFLEGEPILARPLAWARRLRIKARKHRAMVAASAVALAVIGVVLSLWARAALEARRGARLAQEFARECAEVESGLRFIQLLPAHDVRAERDELRSRMRRVEERLGELGAIAEGPARYALGRSALAFHELGAARAHLEKAWAQGYRPPEVAQALGRTLGEQYLAALDEIDGTESESARKDARADAERNLRDPALHYLRAGRAAAPRTTNARTSSPGESAPYLEALIALYEARYEDALAGAEAAQREVPSLYEAARLAGDTYTRMVADRRERGELDDAFGLAERAAGAYRRAIEIGRSDDVSYVGECDRRFQILKLDDDRGKPLDQDAADAISACDQALAVNPDNVRALNQKATLYWRLGGEQAGRGIDPRPVLARAVDAAREALKRDPGSHQAYQNLGSAFLVQGRGWERRYGIDPRPSLLKAAESLERAIAIRPTSTSLVNLTSAYGVLAEYEAEHGGEPLSHWERCEQTALRAIALDPMFATAHNHLGKNLNSRATWELSQGIDPRPSTERAMEALKKAIALQPSYAPPHTNMGESFRIRAEWERLHGLDCRASVEDAVRSYRRAIERMPTYSFGFSNIAEAYRSLALQQIERRVDPSDTLAKAREALDQGLGFNEKNHFNYLERAMIELLAARSRLGDAGAVLSFEAALRAAARSAELDPMDATVPMVESDVLRWQAEWLLGRGLGAEREIDRGLDAAARALALNPKLAEAIALRGTLHALRARVERDPGRQAELSAKALADSRQALAMNPLLAHDYPPPAP